MATPGCSSVTPGQRWPVVYALRVKLTEREKLFLRELPFLARILPISCAGARQKKKKTPIENHHKSSQTNVKMNEDTIC
jgi:hypothetical protein